MTRKELVALEGDMLRPEDVAKYLHIAPQVLREQARRDPSKLGFRVIVCGQHTLIPKWPFLEYVGEKPRYIIREDGICLKRLQEL